MTLWLKDFRDGVPGMVRQKEGELQGDFIIWICGEFSWSMSITTITSHHNLLLYLLSGRYVWKKYESIILRDKIEEASGNHRARPVKWPPSWRTVLVAGCV
jgi:hypothetical protein